MELALSALSFGWNNNYPAVLAPSVGVQRKAHAAYVQHQFYCAFLASLSFENDQATAVFSCRGANP